MASDPYMNVVFDRETRLYRFGDYVSGHVVVHRKKPLNIESITAILQCTIEFAEDASHLDAEKPHDQAVEVQLKTDSLPAGITKVNFGTVLPDTGSESYVGGMCLIRWNISFVIKPKSILDRLASGLKASSDIWVRTRACSTAELAGSRPTALSQKIRGVHVDVKLPVSVFAVPGSLQGTMAFETKSDEAEGKHWQRVCCALLGRETVVLGDYSYTKVCMANEIYFGPWPPKEFEELPISMLLSGRGVSTGPPKMFFNAAYRVVLWTKAVPAPHAEKEEQSGDKDGATVALVKSFVGKLKDFLEDEDEMGTSLGYMTNSELDTLWNSGKDVTFLRS